MCLEIIRKVPCGQTADDPSATAMALQLTPRNNERVEQGKEGAGELFVFK
jgi:hypothetical protein